MKSKTMYQKIWDEHVVYQEEGIPPLLYIDTHYIHEVTSPQAFTLLSERKLKVARSDRTFATCDHNVSTVDQYDISDLMSKMQVNTLIRNCNEHSIKLFGLDSVYQGIVHVIGPELGLTLPGATIVCGDSHTSTHGAFGSIAFGIGTSEVANVLATQCLLQNPQAVAAIYINGNLQKGVSAKDVILTILAVIGTRGGVGYSIEYRGSTVSRMDMEERMTICNMSIEAGARCGMVAPDEVTYEYLKGRMYSPKGVEFEKAVKKWNQLKTDRSAKFDKEIDIDASKITPLLTWGTDPATAIAVSEAIPDPRKAETEEKKNAMKRALNYMNLNPKQKLAGFPIDYVFLGSCTNARISDLREAAQIVKGKKVNSRTIAWVVPGSRQVKIQAEKEGLNRIFIEAGFEWRWSGCSACIAMNEDKIPSGKYCVSTSNRNFEGRQGPGARTFLASPMTAAACAIAGKIVDVRDYL